MFLESSRTAGSIGSGRDKVNTRDIVDQVYDLRTKLKSFRADRHDHGLSRFDPIDPIVAKRGRASGSRGSVLEGHKNDSI